MKRKSCLRPPRGRAACPTCAALRRRLKQAEDRERRAVACANDALALAKRLAAAHSPEGAPNE